MTLTTLTTATLKSSTSNTTSSGLQALQRRPQGGSPYEHEGLARGPPSCDMRLKAEGLILHVDAPAGVDVGKVGTVLRKHKRALIRYGARRRRLEEAASRGLVTSCPESRGCLYTRPHNRRVARGQRSECPPSIVEAAKVHRRRRGRCDEQSSGPRTLLTWSSGARVSTCG